MNHICFERSSSWRSAKAAENPPSTMVPPSISPGTAGRSSRKCTASRRFLIAQRTICALSRPVVIQTFLSSSATPILIRPEELGVDLLRLYQVFQLLEARKRPVFKDFFRHVNPLEQVMKLFRSAASVPSASEPGQMLTNLLKGHAVAP